MGKWGLLRGVAILSAPLFVSVVPVCRGAARCGANTLEPKAFRFAVVSTTPALQEQAPPNSSSATGTPTTRKVKVWTNEELIATRTPADIYIFQKEAQAAALEMEGFNNLASCFAFGQAEGDAEETQKEIDATIQSIRDSEEAVIQSRRALSKSPDNLKLRNQMELAQRMSELNHARERLWKLQEHLRDLEKSTVQTNTSPPSQPTPEQPSPNPPSHN
jgi:hypothetical protein